MLTFIGLGLYDERSITLEGRDALRAADRVFAETYTSHLVGADLADIEAFHGVEIEVRDRAGVEQHPEPILDAAETMDIAFVTAGDTMISTTHVDLRLRAHARGIDTRVIHGVTAESAASSLTGLQNYRFGKATTLPFEYAHGGTGVPQSVIDTIAGNRDRGLHTLVFLDIKADRGEYMTASTAAGMLAGAFDGFGNADGTGLGDAYDDVLAVVVARAGSPDPVVAADWLSSLATRDFGPPLHLLVIPAPLHHVEADALEALAGAPRDALELA